MNYSKIAQIILKNYNKIRKNEGNGRTTTTKTRYIRGRVKANKNTY